MTGWQRGSALTAVAAITLGLGSAQGTAAGGITTSLMLPVTGDVFHPPNPCVPAGENVALNGSAHVVSVIFPPAPLYPPSPMAPAKLFFGLAAVLGSGTATGNTYIGTGAATVDLDHPPNPFMPVVRSVSFTLEGTDGCASAPLPLTFVLNFDSSGNLLPTSRVVNGSAFCDPTTQDCGP